jgi:hypothetical protein
MTGETCGAYSYHWASRQCAAIFFRLTHDDTPQNCGTMLQGEGGKDRVNHQHILQPIFIQVTTVIFTGTHIYLPASHDMICKYFKISNWKPTFGPGYLI